MIYITSDLHFGHDKDFLYEPRGFSNIDDHDNTILKNWNETIRAVDDVYILGDLMLNDNKRGLDYIRQLNGHLHIIIGNHDTSARVEAYSKLRNVVEVLDYASILKYNKYHFYLSHYPTLVSNYDEDRPLRTRTICLCGHTHTDDKFKDMDKGLIYHVELDAHNNRPVCIDQILFDMKTYLLDK